MPIVFDFSAAGLDAVDARVVFVAVDLDRTLGFVLDDAGVLTATRVLGATAFARAVALVLTLARAAFADFVLETDVATAFRAVPTWPVPPFTGLRAAWTAACPGRFTEAFVLELAEATSPDFFFETALVFAIERALTAFDVLAFDDAALDAAAFDFDNMGGRTP